VGPVAVRVSNVDLLEWFAEHERALCADCGDRTCVTLPAARASFCLSCGAVSIDGLRIDVDRRLDVGDSSA
jgi:hypothetical protein